MQATLFNKHIETWKDSLKPNKNNTIIKAADIEVSTHRFSDGFVSLDRVDKLPNGAILVVVSNLKQALVTLGTFEISTISMSSILINPQFQKSTDLVHYINHTYVLQCYLNPIVTTNREMVKAENKYFMVTPSKEMRRAIEVPLDCLYKFKATIVDILNKDESWYSSCKNYSKQVKVIEHIVSCNNCNNENVEYEMRCCLRLEVGGGEQRARAILFEAVKYLLGCRVRYYIESTSVSFERKCAHHATEKIGPEMAYAMGHG
ncbi:hypothetical protein H5410_057598 [Solanum commersonii]|uniref:Uncharacterized protein n=1 Tax=Solanum commersonii TaxID=4109 RepID=A0A9J5WR22_SOLCO|nr:hypothetical protein H5410_057598 [Solanum commersonii]